MARTRGLSFEVRQSRGQQGQNLAPGPGKWTRLPWPARPAVCQAQPRGEEDREPVQGMWPSSCRMPYIEPGTAAGRAGQGGGRCRRVSALPCFGGCGPDHPAWPQDGTRAPRHMALSEASWVLVPGSWSSCPKRSCVCIHRLPGPGQLLGARVRTIGLLSGGCARARQPRSVRHGQRTHSVLEECTRTPTWCPEGWAVPARLRVLTVGLEDATWFTLAWCGQTWTCGGLPESRVWGIRPGGSSLGRV